MPRAFGVRRIDPRISNFEFRISNLPSIHRRAKVEMLVSFVIAMAGPEGPAYNVPARRP